MASPICEKYDPIADTWETVEIEGATPLAAFGWTPLKTSSQLLVVGGTDGDLL